MPDRGGRLVLQRLLEARRAAAQRRRARRDRDVGGDAFRPDVGEVPIDDALEEIRDVDPVGARLVAAARLGPDARVATVQVDSGLKYLAGEVYD